MKNFKQLLTLPLVALMTHSAWAANANFDFSVTPVAENVYSIISPSFGLPSENNKGWNSNSHFVVTDKGVLVFDTGSSKLIGEEIKQAIKSVTDKPVRWVVNSHSHADHWLGNAAFTDTGAEIIASAPATKTMKKYGQADVAAFSRMTKGATGATKLAYPTALLTQREKRKLAGMDIELIFSNDGHSPGDILLWLPKQKVIFGGDVLNSEWMPIMTPDSNVAHLIDTLYAVARLNPAVVLTGHGKTTTVESVIRDANLLTDVQKLVTQGYKNDTKPDDITLKVKTMLGPTYRPLYKNFDSQIKEHVKQLYKEQS